MEDKILGSMFEGTNVPKNAFAGAMQDSAVSKKNKLLPFYLPQR